MNEQIPRVVRDREGKVWTVRTMSRDRFITDREVFQVTGTEGQWAWLHRVTVIR